MTFWNLSVLLTKLAACLMRIVARINLEDASYWLEEFVDASGEVDYGRFHPIPAAMNWSAIECIRRAINHDLP